MSSRATLQTRLWYWQHVSAAVLTLCIVVHIGVIFYAMQGGLTGSEILDRTRGNWVFGTFYAVFVLACAVHVFGGLRNVAQEWFGMSRTGALLFARFFSAVILVLGLVAVYTVTTS